MSDTSKEFTVTITSPDERLWEGQAHSITTENSKGPFDILPGHPNFITMIKLVLIIGILCVSIQPLSAQETTKDTTIIKKKIEIYGYAKDPKTFLQKAFKEVSFEKLESTELDGKKLIKTTRGS